MTSAAAGPDRPKVFCIGLNKTGTLSLHHALQVLGYRSIHDVHLCRKITADVLAGRFPEDVHAADAFGDFPSPETVFDRLGDLFPDARLIFTTRDRHAWVCSRLVHVLHNWVVRGGGWREVHTRDWQRQYDAAHALTAAWSARHPGRLLTLDITRGDGWQALCPFLDVPVPDAPFPHRNSAAAKLAEIAAAYETGPD